MYIVIQYRIQDPSCFWAIVEQDITRTAVDARLLQWRADSNRALCVSLWSADSGKPLHMQFDSAAYHVRIALYATMEDAIAIGLPEHWATEAEEAPLVMCIPRIVVSTPAPEPSPPPLTAA